MKRRLLAAILSLCIVMGMMPAMALAADPEPTPAKTLYVSESGNDSNSGTKDQPLATLGGAIEKAKTSENATIYLTYDIRLDTSIRYWNGDITIASAPESNTVYSISRAGTNFQATSDLQRGGYNGPMFEVGDSAKLTLENIILDDGGYAAYSEKSLTVAGKTPYFVQVESGGQGYTTIAGKKVSNHEIVQDAIITSFSENTTITLGDGAELRNYGGMSAVRASNATLIMKAGSKICDTNGMTRIKGAEGSLGPKGAVWVQNGNFIMEAGAEISDIDGRAVYAEKGQVNIGGTISNLKYNDNFQNAFQGLAVHLRGGANGTISGAITDIALTKGTSSVLHDVDGTLQVPGAVYNIHSDVDGRVINVENAEGTAANVTISGEIYDIETANGYVLYLSEAAKGTLDGSIYDITGKVIYLVDGSGEDYEGDTAWTEFTMTKDAVIRHVIGSSVIEASVSRGSKTSSNDTPKQEAYEIPESMRDHVKFTIDGEITGVNSSAYASNVISMNADMYAFGKYVKNPGDYIDCIIGPNAKIHDNTAYRIIWTQGGTVDISGKIYDNNACVYKGSHNCGDANVILRSGSEIYENNSSNPSHGDWEGDAVIMLGNAILTMEENSSIHDNISSGSAAAIYIYNGGKLVMDGGKIYDNKTTSDIGGQIAYRSGSSWTGVVDSYVIYHSGEIYGNISEGNHDFVILADGEASFRNPNSTTNPERCFTVPNQIITGDIGIYYQSATHKVGQDTVVDYYGKSMTVDPGTKLGLISKDKTENENVTAGSATTLQTAATNYGLSAPFTTFWAYNETGTHVSIKMDAAQAGQLTTPMLDPAKPIYVLMQKTDETGYPATDAEVSLQAATVDADGTIHFDLTTDVTGAAIALAQPADANGALTLSAAVTELQEGKTPYRVPYEVKFDLSKGGISVDAIQSAEITFYSTNGTWNNHKINLSKDTLTGSWTAELSADNFQANGTITTSAMLKITTTSGQEHVFYSNAVDTKMMGGSVIITPADITVYTGGEGYTGVVDSAGQTTTIENGLPEPGYFITLPNWINEMLGGTANAEDLSGKSVLTYDDDQDSHKEWELKPYGTDAHSTDVAGVTTARYIYRIVPGEGTDNTPVRLQLTDPDNPEQVISSDKFVPNSDEQYKAYDMRIYTDEVTADKVTAEITINGQTYTCKVDGTEGQLVVRGLTADNATTEIVKNENAVSGSNISAVAPDGVTYYVNGSRVEVADASGVKLLVDDVLSDGVLAQYIEDNMADIPDGNYTYEEKYLDLVDTKNGNAYLTLGEDQEMTMYWPVPSDMDTSKDFHIVHFEALDRNYADMSSELEKMPPEVLTSKLVTVYGKQYIKFETGSFSPFVLVYEKTSGGGGGGGATTTHTITASTGTGGTIDPSGKVSVTAGSSKTFTIAAADGYEIADVLVDGKSVGAVNTYTFEKVSANHTISASFKKGLVVADPDDTGVSSWLNTKDHAQYLSGYPEGTFEPDSNMTRAEAAQMFYNLLLDQDIESAVAFSDVPADAWYAKAVNTLASLGMINGVGDNKYEPDRSITRAEFTAIAMRFAELPTGGENSFSDVTQNDWFYDVVVGSIRYGWITGYPDGTFRPNATITRAEVTTITNRMLGRSADKAYVDGHAADLRQFSDLSKTHWAYYDIMEATNAHDYTKADGAETWTALHQ